MAVQHDVTSAPVLAIRPYWQGFVEMLMNSGLARRQLIVAMNCDDARDRSS